MRMLLGCFFINLRNVDLEISPLVSGEIYRLFVNTLAADGKYLGQYCENLQLLIQMQLSEKRKTFSGFFFSMSGIYINF